ncbi:MAG: sugar ABC transporter permease, partial [Actinobacteria bacterium]|nr:sugar ABC transporter permease [Actinomycetota bacterium]
MSDTSATAAVSRIRRGALQVGDAAYAASPTPRTRKRRGRGRLRLEIAILTGPAIIVFVALVIFPVALAAYYGFYKWQGYGAPTDWFGLGNYKLILTDPAFHQVLLHNGMIVVLSLVIQGPLAVLLALLLNRKIRGRSLIRVLIFVPFVISEVIVGTGWSLMLQSSGAANDLLH